MLLLLLHLLPLRRPLYRTRRGVSARKIKGIVVPRSVEEEENPRRDLSPVPPPPPPRYFISPLLPSRVKPLYPPLPIEPTLPYPAHQGFNPFESENPEHQSVVRSNVFDLPPLPRGCNEMNLLGMEGGSVG